MNSERPQLSIIIVSYNEWDYLRLTIQSVSRAIANIQAEILLIDNSTNNNIKKHVASHFPFIKIIPNTKNLGFAKANNLGLKQAIGKIALLLNPDILLSEDSLEKVILFYENNPKAGGMGVKMLNGQGVFLKESKRGLTTPMTSMFKMLGLTRLFPQSKFFAPYYHGHLNENKNHSVDILSGAFLAQNRIKTNHFSFLDERYFMYGEDIDLSYQISLKKGKNYYRADNTIIHFKGKTTFTNSKIIMHFYNAMWLFYHKNLKNKYSPLISFIVKTAIFFGQYVAISRLHLRKFQTKNISKPPKETFIISSNTILCQTIRKKLLPCITSISQSENLIATKAEQRDTLFIFDLKTVTTKDVIKFMDDHRNKYKYAFISNDNKYLYSNGNLNIKGDVISIA